MAIKYQNNSIDTIVYQGNDVDRVYQNGAYIWAKHLTFSAIKGTNVSTFSITRTESSEPTVSPNMNSDGTYQDNTVVYTSGIIGNTIVLYSHDKLQITGTCPVGYWFDESTMTLLFDTVKTVNNAKVFTSPVISYSSFIKSGTTYRNIVQVRNNNSIAVVAHITSYFGTSASGTAYSKTVSISPNSTSTYTYPILNITSSTSYTSCYNIVYFTYGDNTSKATAEIVYLEKLKAPIVIQTVAGIKSSTALIFNPNQASATCTYLLEAQGETNGSLVSTSSSSATITINAGCYVTVSVPLIAVTYTTKIFKATLANSNYLSSNQFTDTVDSGATNTVVVPTIEYDGGEDVFGFNVTNDTPVPIYYIATSSYGDGYGGGGIIEDQDGTDYCEFDYSGEQWSGDITFYIGTNSNTYKCGTEIINVP